MVILIEKRAAFINVKQMLNFTRERRSTQNVDRVNLVLFEIITCEMAHLSGKIITVQTFRLFFKHENYFSFILLFTKHCVFENTAICLRYSYLERGFIEHRESTCWY